MKYLILLVLPLLFTSCAELSSDLANPTVQSTAEAALILAGNKAMSTQKAGTDKTVIAQQLIAMGQAVQALSQGNGFTAVQLNATVAQFSPKLATQAAGYSVITGALLTTFQAAFPNLNSNTDVQEANEIANIFGTAAVAVGTQNGG